jgi:two-component sensor histidine kinase
MDKKRAYNTEKYSIGRWIVRDASPAPENWFHALGFAVGLGMAVVATGALLELRSGMMVAFDALGAINVLQSSRARSVSYLIGVVEQLAVENYSSKVARPSVDVGDRGIIAKDLMVLRTNAQDGGELKPLIDKYVNDADTALSDLNSTPFDAVAAARDVAKARRSSDELHLMLTASVGAHRETLQRDISRMLLAVGALIAGVALVSLTQGWELLARGRRLFTTQSDSAARIASLATTLNESQDALARMNRRLTLAMRSARVAVFSIEPSGKVTWSLDGGSGVFGEVSPPFLLSDLSPQSDQMRVRNEVLSASNSREVIEFEMSVEREDKELRWVKVTLLPLAAKEESNLLGSAVDITDIKRREEGNVLLMRELSHRSKNLLAVVQAMARQTARTTPSPVDFYERFGRRLRALAAGHDLLVKSVYVSAELEELIQTQIGGLAPLIGSRLSLAGPSVRLRPEATQNLGMALHELAANAQIHGAMTNPQGRIDISWRFEGSGSDSRLLLDWLESGVPKFPPSSRKGFGSTLILENLPRSLHGTVTLNHLSDGTHCHMEFPLTYLLEGWKPKQAITDQGGISA